LWSGDVRVPKKEAGWVKGTEPKEAAVEPLGGRKRFVECSNVKWRRSLRRKNQSPEKKTRTARRKEVAIEKKASLNARKRIIGKEHDRRKNHPLSYDHRRGDGEGGHQI